MTTQKMNIILIFEVILSMIIFLLGKSFVLTSIYFLLLAILTKLFIIGKEPKK